VGIVFLSDPAKEQCRSIDSHIFGKDNDDEGDPNKQGKENSPFLQPGQTPIDVTRAVKEAYDFAKSQAKLPSKD
jgi:hypothetical protein